MSRELNVAAHLFEAARTRPREHALIAPHGAGWSAVTREELAADCRRIASALVARGVVRGDRACVFLPPGREWVALVYALFALGAVPVLIDPGMGLRGVLACVKRIQPRVFAGVARAQLVRRLFPSAFASVAIALGEADLRRDAGARAFELVATSADDRAAILFTSGSTGPAKGVVYTHGMFDAQLGQLRELYAMQPGDVDLACFAPFALFGPALALTTVLPRIDFSRPASCDPAHIANAIREHRVRQSFGSPAIWSRVAPWCAERGVVLDSLERVMIAGAPVAPRLIERCLAMLPAHGDVHTPYGATEALPVASASGREILARFRERTERGEGNCVGRAAPRVELRVIAISDAPLADWGAIREVARGEPGELVVRGENVTREYAFEPAATATAKIASPEGVWHRMGDVVRVDAEGQLWFLGRKSQRVESERGVLFPMGVENVFDRHEDVEKSALVGVGVRGRQRPFVVVVPKRGARASAAEILAASAANSEAARVEGVLLKRSLPVDLRHNAKIDRGQLARWAEKRVR